MQAKSVMQKRNAPVELTFVRYLPVLGLAILALVLAAVGMLDAKATILESLETGHTYAVGEGIPTSFGLFTALKAEALDGLTSQDLSGVTHGIQNLVLSDRVQMQITLQFRNRSNQAFDLSPDQFRLLGDSEDAGLTPTSGTLQTGPLPPGGSLDASLSFVTARTSRPLWLVFRDPGQLTPIRIAVGAADPNADPNSTPVPEPSHVHPQ